MPDTAYNDSLEQCIISSRGLTHNKNLGDQIWAKIGSKSSFFGHFLKLGSLAFLQIAQYDSLEQCLDTSRGKTHKGLLSFFEIRVISFSENPIDESMEDCLLVEIKFMKTISEAPNWV